MPALFQRIDAVFVRVKNLEKAIEWYTKNLGLSVRWRNDEGGYAAIEIGGMPITLEAVKDIEGFKPYEEAAFIIFARDIEEAHGSLTSLEVETGPIETLYDVRWFNFKDQDGNTIKVCNFAE